MGKSRAKERLSGILSPLFIIFSAVLVITLLLLSIGVSPAGTFGALLSGAFGSGIGLINTLTKAVPISLCALGVAVARQAGIFNIGINGQMMIGALGTVVVGVYLKGLPPFLHVTLCLLAGVLCGMLYALFPTIIYVRKRINLIVIFLLMNTMASKINTWLLFAYLRDPSSTSTATYRIQASAQLPTLMTSPGRLNIGVIISLVISAAMYIYFYKTTAGYELRCCGQNHQASTYAGIKVTRYIGSSLLLGGALAGLAGGIEVLGTYFRLYDGFSPAYGFDGIPIALLAGGNPIGILVGSIAFGALRVGSSNMQVKMGVSSELVSVVQGVLICFIALEYLFRFISGKMTSRRQGKAKEATVK